MRNTLGLGGAPPKPKVAPPPVHTYIDTRPRGLIPRDRLFESSLNRDMIFISEIVYLGFTRNKHFKK